MASPRNDDAPPTGTGAPQEGEPQEEQQAWAEQPSDTDSEPLPPLGQGLPAAPAAAAQAAAAAAPAPPDLDWLSQEDDSEWPDSPLERLFELNDPSAPHYLRKFEKLLATHLREWEQPGAPPSSFLPVFNALLLDQESRCHLTLLMKHSIEGQAEAVKIIVHLLRNRTSIRNPSGYVQAAIHDAMNWLNRPPFDHPEFPAWLERVRARQAKGKGKTHLKGKDSHLQKGKDQGKGKDKDSHIDKGHDKGKSKDSHLQKGKDHGKGKDKDSHITKGQEKGKDSHFKGKDSNLSKGHGKSQEKYSHIDTYLGKGKGYEWAPSAASAPLSWHPPAHHAAAAPAAEEYEYRVVAVPRERRWWWNDAQGYYEEW